MPLRAAIPKMVRNPTSEPSETMPAAEAGGQHAAHERHRQGQEEQQSRPARCRRHLQQEEDHRRLATIPYSRSTPLRGARARRPRRAPRRAPRGKRHAVEALLHLVSRQLRGPARRDVRPDVDAARPLAPARWRWGSDRCVTSAMSLSGTRCRRACRSAGPGCSRGCCGSRACSTRGRRRPGRRGRCHRPPRWRPGQRPARRTSPGLRP